MSASPGIAQPINGTPVSGEVEPQAPNEAESGDDERRRRRRRFLVLFLLLGAFLVLFGLAIWYLLFRQPIPVPVIPGETIMPGYQTSIYGAARPMGVAVSPDGARIYVGATDGDRTARVFDAQGNQIALMQPPKSTGTDHTPVYLAIDPLTGEVYVTYRPTGSIYVYDANGTYQRTYTSKVPDQSWQPLGIAFDKAGNLYVTDVGNSPQRVLEIDRSGNVVRTIGESANLSFPNGLAADDAGYLYVTDSNNGRLVVFAPNGTIAAQVGRGVSEGALGLPRGVAIDGQGRVYVGDATGQGVFVYGVLKTGEQRLDYLGFFGGEGVANGKFEYPNGVAADARGRLYVADAMNDRVQLWSY